jgi:hypothetical protein
LGRKSVRRAGIKVGSITRLQHICLIGEGENKLAGEDIEPFLAVMLVEAIALAVQRNDDMDGV